MGFLSWLRGTPQPPEKPRPHHVFFLERLIEHALHSPAVFVKLSHAPSELEAIWHELGASLSPEERLAPSGLTVRTDGIAAHPIVLVTLPEPARANEAWYLCAVPAFARMQNGNLRIPEEADGPLRFRVFTVERAKLEVQKRPVGFLVEWTGARRRNYDVPDNGSPGAMWKAILEVWSGTRAAMVSRERRVGDRWAKPTASSGVDQLERATWFAEVGRPPVRGWPDSLAEVRVLKDWNQALSMRHKKRFDPGPAMDQLRAGLGEAYQPHVNAVSSLTQQLLRRKFPRLAPDPKTERLLSMLVQLDLITALSALEHPGLMSYEAAEQLVLVYAEGRMPCDWQGGVVTCIF